jgi:hypothetical protein
MSLVTARLLDGVPTTLPRQVERIEEQRLLGVRFARPFPER